MTRGARQAWEAVRLVVASGAIGVHLARAKDAVGAEQKIDADEARVIPRGVGRAGEAGDRRVHAIARGLVVVVEGGAGHVVDETRHVLGGSNGLGVQRGREEQRVQIDAALSRDEPVPDQVLVDEGSRERGLGERIGDGQGLDARRHGRAPASAFHSAGSSAAKP